MNSDQLVFGFIEYVVFLLSTTCHEAAHSLIALLGGDKTAHAGGQVSLNPLPHIRREPFGMVIMPLIGIVAGGMLIGWASTPYDPEWSAKYPRRAALMSLAGPGANFALALIAAILMRIGLAVGYFTPVPGAFSQIVGAAGDSGVAEGIATVLSVFLSLNILLGIFNLIPIPPLDGYSVLGLFTTEAGALRLQQFRVHLRTFAIIGLVVAWQLIDRVYPPVLAAAMKFVYLGYSNPL
jgi:Zn-dependent protease